MFGIQVIVSVYAKKANLVPNAGINVTHLPCYKSSTYIAHHEEKSGTFLTS